MLEKLKDLNSGYIPYFILFTIYSFILFIIGYILRRSKEKNTPRNPDDRDLDKIWKCLLVTRYFINREISSEKALCIIMQDDSNNQFQIIAFKKEITLKRTIENEESNFIVGEYYELKFNNSTQDLVWKHIITKTDKKKVSETPNFSEN